MAGKASFNWIDPLLLDQQLTEEERMVRDSAEQFAQDKLAPRVLEAFRHERLIRRFFVKWARPACWGR
jgi:glutaryl-CoA dehydrogenase